MKAKNGKKSQPVLSTQATISTAPVSPCEVPRKPFNYDDWKEEEDQIMKAYKDSHYYKEIEFNLKIQQEMLLKLSGDFDVFEDDSKQDKKQEKAVRRISKKIGKFASKKGSSQERKAELLEQLPQWAQKEIWLTMLLCPLILKELLRILNFSFESIIKTVNITTKQIRNSSFWR